MRRTYVYVLLCVVLSLPALAQMPTPPAGGMPMDPAMHQRMMAMMQDLLIMTQNTVVETPQGIIVLQGNRLLRYSPTLQLQNTIVLPLPPAAPATTTPPPLRSMVMARVVPLANGELLITRGQQMIRLDRNLNVINQTQLPDLPPLTPAELNVVVPLATYMMMMMPMGMPGGGGMAPGMAH